MFYNECCQPQQRGMRRQGSAQLELQLGRGTSVHGLALPCNPHEPFLCV